MGMDLKPTIVVLRNYLEPEWPQKDFVAECNISLATLAVEGARQIIAHAQSGIEVTGKKYKLDIETVDEPGIPLRFSWK